MLQKLQQIIDKSSTSNSDSSGISGSKANYNINKKYKGIVHQLEYNCSYNTLPLYHQPLQLKASESSISVEDQTVVDNMLNNQYDGIVRNILYELMQLQVNAQLVCI